MAALKRSKKTGALRKNQQGKLVTKRGKLPLKPKRNVCIIRFPRSGYLTSCPLVSWYFNRRMQNDVLSLQKTKHNLSPCMVDAHHHHKMSLRLLGRQPHPSHTCSVFLRAALKEVASKKRAKWVAASSSSKKRRRYADNEIFYRLAKPSGMEETEDGRSGMAAGANEMTPTSLGTTQPTAGELQEALS